MSVRSGFPVGRWLPHTLWLVAVWVALWGELSFANVAGGLVVAVAVQLAFPGAGPRGVGPVRVLAMLHFAGYFAVQLVRANILLAWEVLTPRRRLVSGVIGIPLRTNSDTVTTVIANAISLTPGTLTLTVRQRGGSPPRMLYAHILHPGDVDAVRAGLARMETLAIRAFGARDTEMIR